MGTLNSVFTIQTKNTITKIGIKQVVTIITAIASINRFRTFLNCSITLATEPVTSLSSSFALSISVDSSSASSVVSPKRLSLTALAESTVISMDLEYTA